MVTVLQNGDVQLRTIRFRRNIAVSTPFFGALSSSASEGLRSPIVHARLVGPKALAWSHTPEIDTCSTASATFWRAVVCGRVAELGIWECGRNAVARGRMAATYACSFDVFVGARTIVGNGR